MDRAWRPNRSKEEAPEGSHRASRQVGLPGGSTGSSTTPPWTSTMPCCEMSNHS